MKENNANIIDSNQTLDNTHISINPTENSINQQFFQNTLTDISFYTDLALAESVSELKEKINTIVQKLGFSDFFFTVLNQRDTGILTTFPEEIYKHHLSGASAKNNLLLQHAGKSLAPIYLSSVIEYAQNTPFDTDIFNSCFQFDKALNTFEFHDCYSIARPSKIEGNHAVLIITNKGTQRCDFKTKIEHYKPILHLLCEAISVIGTITFPTYFSSFSTQYTAITPKPLRLLNTLAKDNITLKEAAKRLCISLDTANKHIAAAKAALGANTQAAAIYRAIKAGLIDYDDY